ncbi:LuxR family transcriptional regulator [Marinobacterium arenosum]|uniref:LuxR family transcriptional regulator n=1 Tax=Marinobacterium arenosum TaxID=2862496 RepID=UPI001C9398E4|nr:response regulator transcription factor [Marinobacterium arenosum]MBY4675184.1 response regulator transcription factor [Marinobacterium arenosum]
MTATRKIIIADGSPLYRQGCRIAAELSDLDVELLSCDSLVDVLLQLSCQSKVQLLVIDANLPGLANFAALKSIGREYGVGVLLMTNNNDPAFARRAFFNGAHGVIGKDAALETLAEAMQRVLAGGFWRPVADPGVELRQRERVYFSYLLRRLSEQEKNVLNLVKDGLRNKQIAQRMCLTEHTVKSHMSSILRKLNVENRTRLVMAVQQLPGMDQEQLSA